MAYSNIIDYMINIRLKNATEVDKFMHVAAIIIDSRMVCCSINQSRLKYHCQGVKSIHSEIAAIKKLPYRDISKKKKNVDMIVIRVTKTGKLSSSQPCEYCVKHLSEMNNSYRINNIFFSDNRGIVKTKLTDLCNSIPKHVSGGFIRRKSYSTKNKINFS